ncbi:uncharacterized protein [Typha angustifolia]|uniref:uncharacterized protein n=1 Tax=Typha angustifolia TaxID=59011 RepID=UPI003C2FB261
MATHSCLVFSTQPNMPSIGSFFCILCSKRRENEPCPIVIAVGQSLHSLLWESNAQPRATGNPHSPIKLMILLTVTSQMGLVFQIADTKSVLRTKSSRGWAERKFSGNTSIFDLGFQDRREVNAGIATVFTRDGWVGQGGNGASVIPSMEFTHLQANSSTCANNSDTSASCVIQLQFQINLLE